MKLTVRIKIFSLRLNYEEHSDFLFFFLSLFFIYFCPLDWNTSVHTSYFIHIFFFASATIFLSSSKFRILLAFGCGMSLGCWNRAKKRQRQPLKNGNKREQSICNATIIDHAFKKGSFFSFFLRRHFDVCAHSDDC